jgi:very-short-patch-repair endonuclease
VTVHRGGRLDRADRTQLDAVPITTPVRTLIDIASRLEDDRLLAVTEDLIRRGLVRPDRLRARLDALRSSGRVGGGRLADLLERRGDGRPLESALEALVWRIIVESGIRLPERQFWITAAGRRYRLDFAWPDLKLGIECDGQRYHDGRSRWNPDRARLADLAAIDWRVMPITWDACKRERERVVAWLRRAVPRAA